MYNPLNDPLNPFYSRPGHGFQITSPFGYTPASYPAEPAMPSIPVLPAVVQAMLARSVEDCAKEHNARTFGNPLTHAAMLLDESGSMLRHRAAALEGYNAQVGVIKEGARGAGKTIVSLNVFNSSPRQVLSGVDVEILRPLSDTEYRPAGGTALFDALGDTIAMLLAQPGANDPNTAFLVSAFTDGEENSSTRYTAHTLKHLITRLEATGRWTFTLMGPNGGAQELAGLLNLNLGNVAAFDPTRRESVQQAFATMSMASNGYMNMRSVGETASACFYSSVDGEK